MIKWAEFRQDDVLYEAFLPEHEREIQEWLLRASSRGHVLEERRRTLSYEPRFGPDSGDVAALEAELDKAIARVATLDAPSTDGTYVAKPIEVEEPSPQLHFVLHMAIQDYCNSEGALGISVDQTADFLELPPGMGAAGLFPFAVTPKRFDRMRKSRHAPWPDQT